MMRDFEVWIMDGKRVLVRIARPLSYSHWGFRRFVKALP